MGNLLWEAVPDGQSCLVMERERSVVGTGSLQRVVLRLGTGDVVT